MTNAGGPPVAATPRADDATPKSRCPWTDRSGRAGPPSFNHAFIGLIGQYAKIKSAARSLGVDAEKPKTITENYEVTHGNNLLVFRADHQASLIYVAGVSNIHLSDDLAADLPKLLHNRI
jgi:cytochrome oxidase Cu insertion factor (SCO1/SenC/PrrC family)